MSDIPQALEAIQKKISGKHLSYKEIYTIMDDIAHERLGDILMTYFAASGYTIGFSDEELYFLTKAMIETGDRLAFKGIVADKHSIGGVPGTRTTLIVIPIVAAAGFTIPKSSSRAITTPGGTADDMEVLASVTHTKEKIYQIVEKTGACIVWGGSVDIAPADDDLIRIESPLMLESYDKILVSIMAKKVAFGSNHLVIDLPYGKHVKVPTLKDAELVQSKFEYLAKRFGMKIVVHIHKIQEPAGRGLGPLLETRDALWVLEQKSGRPLDLESRAVSLAGQLLDLCLLDSPVALQKQIATEFGSGTKWAASLLSSGHALKKMREIIKAQGGNSAIIGDELRPGQFTASVRAKTSGQVVAINSKNASIIAKILGAPKQKKSGMYLHKKIGQSVDKGELLFSLYSEKAHLVTEAKDSLVNFPIVEII